MDFNRCVKRYLSRDGVIYKTEAHATHAYRQYAALKLVSMPFLPDVQIIEEHLPVEIAKAFVPDIDINTDLHFQEQVFKVRFPEGGAEDNRDVLAIARTVRGREDRERFQFIVKRGWKDEFPVNQIGEHIVVSNSKGGRTIAITSEADLFFLRCSLEECKAYDRITGRKVLP
jgi:hypothetical protein